METLIVTGGNITKTFLNKIFLERKFENIIASDKGLKKLNELNIKPNYIIGDFDSVSNDILEIYRKDKAIKIIKLSTQKDYTDTHMALKLAIELKSDNIIIVGAIGTRMDHTVSNIHILKDALDKSVNCILLDENNEIRLIKQMTMLGIDNDYKYISLIPFTTIVEGITLKGFKYSLLDEILSIGESIGVSNEQLADEASIDIKKGILILIRSKD